jgi:hypothetical protein
MSPEPRPVTIDALEMLFSLAAIDPQMLGFMV